MRKKTVLLVLLCSILLSSFQDIFAQNKIVLDSLLIEWETEKNVEIKINISEALFEELLKGDYNKAIGFAKSEYNESKVLGSTKLEIYALNHIAMAYSKLGEFDSAGVYANKALDLCIGNDFELERNITYISLGSIYTNIFLLNKSSTYIFKTLGYFEESKNIKYLARAYLLIGWTYLYKERYNKADEFFNKAYKLNKSVNNKVGLAYSYNSFASLYSDKQELDKAIPFYEKALKYGKETYNNNLLAVIHFNLAMAYQLEDDLGKAKQSIVQAIKFDKESHNPKRLAYDYNVLGSIYIDSDSLIKAEHFIELAYNTGKETNDADLMYYSLSNLVDLNYENKDFKKAFDYLITIKEMDTLFPRDKSKDVAQLEMQYELNKQQQAHELEQQKRKYQNIILVGSLVLGLLIISLLYFAKSNKAKKNRLERELLQEKLEQKNKELATYVMYLVKKNELISSISKQLIKVKLNAAKEENKIVLNEVINEMNTNIKDGTWKEFEIRFQEVHAGFYNKLAKQYPTLSVNERRLSAFLKLNMTTKEISAITYQSISAIEVARTRLRKKLGITNSETNLVSFFAQI
jgi:tetratricopeptide (TPR) repeat protein/DNA-binding CsgD family transcriptional regulator